MKRIAVLLMTSLAMNAFAQDELSEYDNLQNWRQNDKRGINVFEDPKTDNEFTGMKVRVGGDFALQFQALSQDNLTMRDTALAGQFGGQFPLDTLGADFNLPKANLNLDVQLQDGVRMHLRTYLSARHHAEAWVKGGYLQIDKLDFIKEDFASGLMEMLTVRVGMDEINYGDAHFRRTDNGRAIYNPFVGNYVMDAFTTEAFAEVLFRKSGLLAMAAISNGKLNQSVITNNKNNSPVTYFQLGYDDQITDDFRLRITGSGYISSGSHDNGTYLFNGDRGGSRYYKLLNGSDFEGRFTPRFRKYSAYQGAIFTKFKGLEFFGFYETVLGGDKAAKDQLNNGTYNQMAAEMVYRFGGTEQFYLAGRYNIVQGYDHAENNNTGTPQADDKEVHRWNAGGGWFMNKNVVTKVEYVSQRYTQNGWEGSIYQGASFDGIVVEAAISF